MMENKKPNPSNYHLPSDLLSEILSRLPVKSLLRFRCVSKSWRDLVDDDAKFARSHLKTFINNRDETGLFVVRQGPGVPRRKCEVRCSDTFEAIQEAPCSFSGDLCIVVSSVDGLILLNSFIKNELMVWNPSIRKLREIPPLVHQIRGNVEQRDFGFGYDSVADDYKVVRLIFAYNSMHSVAIYSLRAGSWRMIKFQGKGSSCSTWHWKINDYFIRGNFRGSLHLIVRDEKRDRVWDLVSFDLSNEVFSCTNTPAFMGLEEVRRIKDGCSLAVLDKASPDKPVWVLDYESMSWIKRCSYNSLFGTIVLFFKKNGDVLTWRPCSYKTAADENGNKKVYPMDKVRSYNPEKNESRKLYNQLDRSGFCGFISDVCCYVESLIQP